MAQAETSSGSQEVKINTSAALQVTFRSTGTDVGSDITLNFNNVSDYANGIISADQTVEVISNKDFTVSVKSAATNFSYSGNTTPAPTMPVSGVLALMITGNNTQGSIASAFSNNSFRGINANSQAMINNGKAGQGRDFGVKYKATPGFSYPAGSYSVDIIYTATQL